MQEEIKKVKKIGLLLVILIFIISGCVGGRLSDQEKEWITDPILPKENTNQTDSSKESSENESKDKQSEINGEGDRGNQENQVARIIFLGDNMMAGKVEEVMGEKGNDYPLLEFMPILQNADFIIANLETAVGKSGETLADMKKYAFQTDPARLSLFEPIREKLLFSLANNHAMDAPLAETMKELDQLGYTYIGVGNNREEAFNPFVKKINGVTFAVIAASKVIPFAEWAAGASQPGMASAYNDQPLLETVQKWNNKVDYVIVYMHWGEELVNQPNQVQLDLESKLKEAGAHLIIGSHPHVLQEIHWNGNKQLTAYSLGNFVFTTSSNRVANDTIALELHLSQDRIEQVHAWPGEVRFGLVRYLSEDEERRRVFERLQELSPKIEIDRDGRITIMD